MERSAPVDGFSLAYERHGASGRVPVMLIPASEGGHFIALEAPDRMAAAIRAAVGP